MEICPQYLPQCWRTIFALENKNGNIHAEGCMITIILHWQKSCYLRGLEKVDNELQKMVENERRKKGEVKREHFCQSRCNFFFTSLSFDIFDLDIRSKSCYVLSTLRPCLEMCTLEFSTWHSHIWFRLWLASDGYVECSFHSTKMACAVWLVSQDTSMFIDVNQ